jgi:hypothetical protein
MTETTDRLALPLLIPGQAQKEIWHNEALMLIDGLVQPSVIAVAPATVPTTPALGACWIIGASPTGVWAGKAQHLACWTSGGWRFMPPREGMSCWNVADALTVRYTGGAWVKGVEQALSFKIGGQQVVGARSAAILNVTGGSTVDVEARFAINTILAMLRYHGLISP